jgi:hypothetical protein
VAIGAAHGVGDGKKCRDGVVAEGALEQGKGVDPVPGREAEQDPGARAGLVVPAGWRLGHGVRHEGRRELGLRRVLRPVLQHEEGVAERRLAVVVGEAELGRLLGVGRFVGERGLLGVVSVSLESSESLGDAASASKAASAPPTCFEPESSARAMRSPEVP